LIQRESFFPFLIQAFDEYKNQGVSYFRGLKLDERWKVRPSGASADDTITTTTSHTIPRFLYEVAPNIHNFLSSCCIFDDNWEESAENLYRGYAEHCEGYFCPLMKREDFFGFLIQAFTEYKKDGNSYFRHFGLNPSMKRIVMRDDTVLVRKDPCHPSITRFIEERCILGFGYKITESEIVRRFKTWAHDRKFIGVSTPQVFRRALKQNFSVETSSDGTRSYRGLCFNWNPTEITKFIQESCDIGKYLSISLTDLYHAYAGWCIQPDGYAPYREEFNEIMARKFRISENIGVRQIKQVSGIALKNP
jgi:hypothetical protein